MRDLRCDILADIAAGKIVSPRRIKRLIREDGIIIDGYKKFLGNSEETDREVARKIEGLRSEIGALKAMLAASESVLDTLDDAIAGVSPLRDAEKRKALENMRAEWGSHSAGISSHWIRHIKPGAVELATGSEG
jgi:hypothetical protein